MSLSLGLSSLALTPRPAAAGNYGPATYSGGTSTSGDHLPLPYSSYGSGYGGSAAGGGTQSFTCTGAVTASFTWQPASANGPPPQTVSVTQTCVAGWSSHQSEVAPIGQCSNGLGTSQGTTGPTTDNNGYTFMASGVSGADARGNPIPHYSAQAGGATVTVTCTPSATITGSLLAGQMSAGVVYTCTISAITIGMPTDPNSGPGAGTGVPGDPSNPGGPGAPGGPGNPGGPGGPGNPGNPAPGGPAPGGPGNPCPAPSGPGVFNWGGATQDSSGNWHILIGQGCNTSITGIPQELLPGIVYQWTVTGTKFQGWNVSADQSTATLVPGPGPLDQATAHWYWNEKASTETVTADATITPPPGQGDPFTVEASQNFKVEEPTFDCNLYPGKIVITADGLELETVGNTAHPFGSAWACRVQTPALYGPGGSCNFSQIISPGRSHTYSTGTVPCPANNTTGLDTGCPYPSPADGSDNYTVGTGTNAGWPADNSRHETGDSPSTLLFNKRTGDPALSVTVTDSFNTFLMYRPPGDDVQPVPLKMLSWNWRLPDFPSEPPATISEPNGNWPRPANADGTLIGPVNSTGAVRTYAHPTWTRREVADTLAGW